MSLLPNTYGAQNARTALRNSLRNYLGEPGLAQAERTGFEAPLLQSLLEAAQLLDGLGANLQELVVRPTTVASSGDNPQGLSAREIEIVSLIAAGLSNSAIATRLVLSTRTVERHIENIYAKLGVHGRAARAAVATYAARKAVWGPGHGIASDATRS
jgi:DNA-binding NarL/FixJ family response regulator